MEQFFPALPYRTGAYAPNGVPWANGYADYLKLINARDGGIGGVKITYESARRLRHRPRRRVLRASEGQGSTGAAVFQPLSTGITYATTDKTVTDKIPLITAGYGRADSIDGEAFPFNFRCSAPTGRADILVQHVGKLNGGLDKLKGKKIASSITTRPMARSRSRCCRSAPRCTASNCCCCRSPTRASSRRRPGCRSASSVPTTCSCGAGV